jgi:energy-coupling factor transport system permease protein
MGGFLPLESVLHRLDPRTKLIGLAALLAAVFLSPKLSGIAVSTVAVASLAVLSRAGWKIWWSALARFFWMLIIVFGVNLLFRQEGRPVFAGEMELPVTWDGIARGIGLTAQIGLAIMLSLMVTLTTSPSQLARALERLGQPLERLDVPVRELTLTILLAIRFLPLLHHELQTIVDAQKSRGVEFATGTPMFRARNFVSVLVPALSGALRRAEIVATAMTARGFSPDKDRSSYKTLRFSGLDYLSWICLGVFVLGKIIFFG